MRVLHINVNYITSELHQTMIRHFNNNIDSVVFVPTYNKENCVIIPDTNVIVEECFKKWDRLFFFRKQKKIYDAIECKVNLDNVDLIHAYTLFTDGNVAYKLARKYKIPYVVAVRNTDINAFFRYKPYLIPLGIKIIMGASAVFFLSDSYKDTVLNKYIPSSLKMKLEHKMHVIPNGIDDFWIQNRYTEKPLCNIEEKIKNKNLSVLCVGKINKNKNIPMIQKALSILVKSGWHVSLNVIGEIEDYNEYSIIQQDKYTHCIPAMDRSFLISEYRKANVFILASHTESFGLVYAEAMSQALPVLYTKGQGFDRQFPDGHVGFAVDSYSEKDIYNKITRIMDDYVNISARALEESRVFDWYKICDVYYEIYQRILRGCHN